MARTKNLEKHRDEFVKLYKKGYSLNEIGKMYNVTKRSVMNQITKVIDLRKVSYTEEEKEMFYQDYLNGMKIVDISRKYNRSYDSIKRFIAIKKGKTTNHTRQYYVLIDNILKDYKNKMSISKISKKYNISNTTVHNYLCENGVKLRTYQETSRSCNVNDNYFNVLDEKKAYELGVVFSVASLIYTFNSKLIILSKTKDKVRPICNVVSSFTDKKNFYHDPNCNVLRFSISSNEMFDDIVRYGFDTDELNIDEELRKPFFDGYFELNLSIYKEYISISTRKNKLTTIIEDYLIHDIGISKSAICYKGFSINIFRTYEVVKLLKIHEKAVPKLLEAYCKYNNLKWETALDEI